MRIFILIIASLCLFGCVNLKNYYYPYDDCIPYKVYKYECFSDTTKTQYWKMSYSSKFNSFVTESFNYKFERIEYFEESIEKTGTLLIQFSAVKEGQEQESFPPISNDVYKWVDKSPSKYDVKFYSGSELLRLEKKRVYLGQATKEIQSGKYNCVKFKEYYTMTIEGTNDQFSYNQTAYYADGLGMIKYERTLPYGAVVELELTRVLNEREWEKLKSQ